MIKSPWLKSCAKCMRIYTAINTPSIFAPLRIRWMTNHSGLTAWYLVIYVGKRVKTNKGRPRSFVFYISPRRPLIQITSKFDWISRPLNLDFLEILWKNNDLAIFPSEKKKKYIFQSQIEIWKTWLADNDTIFINTSLVESNGSRENSQAFFRLLSRADIFPTRIFLRATIQREPSLNILPIVVARVSGKTSNLNKRARKA